MRTYHVNLPNEKQYVVFQHPNQKVVQIHKLCENGHTNPNMRAQEAAMNDLSDSAFKLYNYLVWKPHMGLWALCKDTIKQKEYVFRNSVNELIEKGYLVAGVLQNSNEVVEANGYHFYELPKKPKTTVCEAVIPNFSADRQVKLNRKYEF